MKIAACALKVDDKLFTGTTHMACTLAIFNQAGLTADEKLNMLLHSEDGFVTDTGLFVTREKAFSVATQAQQMIDHPYAQDPKANKEFYGGDDPRLDSGLLREFAPFTLNGKKRLFG